MLGQLPPVLGQVAQSAAEHAAQSAAEHAVERASWLGLQPVLTLKLVVFPVYFEQKLRISLLENKSAFTEIRF